MGRQSLHVQATSGPAKGELMIVENDLKKPEPLCFICTLPSKREESKSVDLRDRFDSPTVQIHSACLNGSPMRVFSVRREV